MRWKAYTFIHRERGLNLSELAVSCIKAPVENVNKLWGLLTLLTFFIHFSFGTVTADSFYLMSVSHTAGSSQVKPPLNVSKGTKLFYGIEIKAPSDPQRRSAPELRWKPRSSLKITFLSLPQLLISLIDFAFPAEVRDCRHKINWFQILIPLTAELSRTPCHRSPIHPNSVNVVQTNKRRKTGTSRTSLLFDSVLLFSPLLHHWLMFIW